MGVHVVFAHPVRELVPMNTQKSQSLNRMVTLLKFGNYGRVPGIQLELWIRSPIVQSLANGAL
jgi:hypothetical protein